MTLGLAGCGLLVGLDEADRVRVRQAFGSALRPEGAREAGGRQRFEAGVTPRRTW
ncbi:hypothetical protein ACFWBR_25675 [Streptomyces sp. NPDC060006]|uniref:hypothetical protein n=1 Tax=unclassified Streptomyces TaxID=2593676 RepID=UPI003645F1DB